MFVYLKTFGSPVFYVKQITFILHSLFTGEIVTNFVHNIFYLLVRKKND